MRVWGRSTGYFARQCSTTCSMAGGKSSAPTAADRRGGGHIPPGSRAVEAQFELQKLPPIIESLRGELTSHPLRSETRQRIEEQIASLEQQLAHHAQGRDDPTQREALV